MNWLSQNWIWIVVAVVLLMRRGGLAGCGMGHGSHGARKDAASSSDPVTGKPVDTQHAVTAYYNGRVYYFESAGTRARFGRASSARCAS